MSYYWLSFCSSDRPEGDQFLGGCLIEAEDVDDAIKKYRQRGCNPGGEVACLQVHEKYGANIDRFKLNHLYSKQEVIDTGEYRTWQDALNSGDIK